MKYIIEIKPDRIPASVMVEWRYLIKQQLLPGDTIIVEKCVHADRGFTSPEQAIEAAEAWLEAWIEENKQARMPQMPYER